MSSFSRPFIIPCSRWRTTRNRCWIALPRPGTLTFQSLLTMQRTPSNQCGATIRQQHQRTIFRSLLTLEFTLFLFAAGCKEPKRSDQVQVQEPPGAEQAAGAAAQATRAQAGSPRAPTTPGSNNKFHPVVLDEFYQRQFMDYRPSESWAQVPSGETNFDSVPFLMFGKIDLTGLGRAR